MERKRYVAPRCYAMASNNNNDDTDNNNNNNDNDNNDSRAHKRPRRSGSGAQKSSSSNNRNNTGDGGVVSSSLSAPSSSSLVRVCEYDVTLRRATRRQVWGFLIYKHAFPVRVGRVDDAQLHATLTSTPRCCSATATATLRDDDDANNVDNTDRAGDDAVERADALHEACLCDVTPPLLQKDDVIVRIDGVVPRDHATALAHFHAAQRTMRLRVRRRCHSRNSMAAAGGDAVAAHDTLNTTTTTATTVMDSTTTTRAVHCARADGTRRGSHGSGSSNALFADDPLRTSLQVELDRLLQPRHTNVAATPTSCAAAATAAATRMMTCECDVDEQQPQQQLPCEADDDDGVRALRAMLLQHSGFADDTSIRGGNNDSNNNSETTNECGADVCRDACRCCTVGLQQAVMQLPLLSVQAVYDRSGCPLRAREHGFTSALHAAIQARMTSNALARHGGVSSSSSSSFVWQKGTVDVVAYARHALAQLARRHGRHAHTHDDDGAATAVSVTSATARRECRGVLAEEANASSSSSAAATANATTATTTTTSLSPMSSCEAAHRCMIAVVEAYRNHTRQTDTSATTHTTTTTTASPRNARDVLQRCAAEASRWRDAHVSVHMQLRALRQADVRHTTATTAATTTMGSNSGGDDTHDGNSSNVAAVVGSDTTAAVADAVAATTDADVAGINTDNSNNKSATRYISSSGSSNSGSPTAAAVAQQSERQQLEALRRAANVSLSTLPTPPSLLPSSASSRQATLPTRVTSARLPASSNNGGNNAGGASAAVVGVVYSRHGLPSPSPPPPPPPPTFT